MRALGLDLGSKRVGVAVSDSDGRVATPVEVLQRTGDRKAAHRAVSALVEEGEGGVDSERNGSGKVSFAVFSRIGEKFGHGLFQGTVFNADVLDGESIQQRVERGGDVLPRHPELGPGR